MTHSPIMMQVSEQSDFIKYWLMLRRRWLPAGTAFVIVLVFAFLRVYQEEPQYVAKGQLKFDEKQRSSKLIGLDSAVDEAERSQTSVSWQRSLDTEILSMASPEQLMQVVQNIEDPSLRPQLSKLKSDLKINKLEETNVVEILFSSTNPQLSAVVVNKIMKQYLVKNLKTNQASTIAAISFINQQLPEVRQRVYAADSTLRRFKETHQINDLDSSKSASTTIQTELQDTFDKTELQLVDVKTQQAELQSLLGLNPQQAIVAISSSQSSISSSLVKLEKQLAEARSSLQADHPVIQELVEQEVQLKALQTKNIELATQSGNLPNPQSSLIPNQQNDLRTQLIQLEVKRKGLSNQLLVMKNQLLRYRQRAIVLPKLEQRLRDLERNAKAADTTYQSLLKQVQELKVTTNQATPNVVILEKAAIPKPTRTTYMSAAMRGGMAGLLLAVSVVYFLERIDRKLKSKEAIQQAYPYQILGEIPTFSDREGEYSNLPTLANPSSHISESYRMLQANLKFLSLECAPRIIVVTSAIAQEGKSTTCANLAASLAHMNHSVLLIDADIRLASQHHIWELRNQEGLTHILLHKNSLELPTHRVIEGLDLITAGKVSSNPLQMLESKEFSSFVHEQLDSYDYIVIDSPPLVSVADPLIIGKIADGILLVARPDHLERESAQKAHELLAHSNLSVLGTVINGVIEKNEPYSYYSYYGRYTDEKLSLSKKEAAKKSFSETVQK